MLEDFPTSSENVAALLHPAVDASSQLDAVKQAVANLMEEKAVHLSEVNGRLQFMSEAVAEIESAKAGIMPYERELRKVLSEKLSQIFTPGPAIRLEGTRSVAAGIKTAFGASIVSLLGEREPVHFIIEFVEPASYERRRDERIGDSGQPANRNAIFWIARQDPALESLLIEIVRCREIYNQNRNKPVEIQVGDYLDGQWQRAERLTDELEQRLRSALGAGSFIFRGAPVAVASRHAEINSAAMAQLDEVARKVFSKYSLAPIQAEGQLAERFLKTHNLVQIASQNDPLGLVVSSAGQKKINSDITHWLQSKTIWRRTVRSMGRNCSMIFSPRNSVGRKTRRVISFQLCWSRALSSSGSAVRTSLCGVTQRLTRCGITIRSRRQDRAAQAVGVSSAIRLIGKSANPGRTEPK